MYRICVNIKARAWARVRVVYTDPCDFATYFAGPASMFRTDVHYMSILKFGVSYRSGCWVYVGRKLNWIERRDFKWNKAPLLKTVTSSGSSAYATPKRLVRKPSMIRIFGIRCNHFSPMCNDEEWIWIELGFGTLSTLLSPVLTARVHIVARLKKLLMRKVGTKINPIQARGGTLCPLTKITADLQNGLEFRVTALWLFFLYIFSFRKVQFHQPVLLYVAMATIRLFCLILKSQISIVFQVFPPERNFLWDNLLCFGHHNTLRSLIKANMRTVIMERFQKIHLHKFGHQQ